MDLALKNGRMVALMKDNSIKTTNKAKVNTHGQTKNNMMETFK